MKISVVTPTHGTIGYMQTNKLGQFVKVAPEARFWDKVLKTSSCWEWQGKRRKDGYGVISIEGKQRRAHRFSVEMRRGPLTPDKKVLHSCDNPPCVRPSHLRVGTQKDNLLEMRKRDRNAYARRGALHPNAKFSDKEIHVIRGMFLTGLDTQEGIARKFNTTQQQISRIVRHQRYA